MFKYLAIAIPTALLISACGGGGGGDTSKSTAKPPESQKPKDSLLCAGSGVVTISDIDITIADYDMDGDDCLNETEADTGYEAEKAKIDARTVAADITTDDASHAFINTSSTIGTDPFVSTGSTKTAQVSTSSNGGNFTFTFDFDRPATSTLTANQYYKIWYFFHPQSVADAEAAGSPRTYSPSNFIARIISRPNGVSTTVTCEYKNDFTFDCLRGSTPFSFNYGSTTTESVLFNATPASGYINIEIQIVNDNGTPDDYSDDTNGAFINNYASIPVSFN